MKAGSYSIAIIDNSCAFIKISKAIKVYSNL